MNELTRKKYIFLSRKSLRKQDIRLRERKNGASKPIQSIKRV